MNRRATLLALLALGATGRALDVRAQAGRTYRVASAWMATEAAVRPYEQVFLAALREHGYAVGRNLVYESRYADGQPARLPALVDELIALKPDVLAGIEQVAGVMKGKTSTIPIVLTNASDPIAAGLVQSLARPGGNITGTSTLYEQLGPKHMELMREILPRAKSVAQLLDTNVPSWKAAEANARRAAKKLGLSYFHYYVTSRAEVEQAFVEMAKNRPDALVGGAGSGMLFGLRKVTIENTARLRIADISTVASYADLGGLMSYGPSLEEAFRLAATYVDRILKGARPADLPVQQPTRFEMVINLKTAKALGVKIPQSILLRADRVIE